MCRSQAPSLSATSTLSLSLSLSFKPKTPLRLPLPPSPFALQNPCFGFLSHLTSTVLTMHTRSFIVDSQSKAQDLASTILASSSSPSEIDSACSSIELFLRSHSPDQSRHFFSISFPTLICKLFGFDDAVSSNPKSQSPKGWIDSVLAFNDPNLANRVFALFAPNGVLFQSIFAVDRQSFVRFVFPVERLPEWARFMLSSKNDCRHLSDLCPLFRSRVKEDSVKGSLFQIQLNVFEYFMFWFAYFPVCRGNSENLDLVSVPARSKKMSKLENWASSFAGFSGVKRLEQKVECNLYIRLLYAYLRAFVPTRDLHEHTSYHTSLLQYSSGFDGSTIERAEFFINTLLNYWLIACDFSPFPVSVSKSFGLTFQFRSVLGETPPASGLGEVVKLLVKYLNLNYVAQFDGTERLEHSESLRQSFQGLFNVVKSRDVSLVSPSIYPRGSWNLFMQRPLYRYILRTFLFCPIGSSMKNVSEVFSVWVSYIEPWAASLKGFSELDAIINEPTKNEREEEASGYSASWQGYVLFNYLYYSSLTMHFIGFAHKFLLSDVEIILQMLHKVLDVLTSSKELIDLIKNVDTVFHSKQDGSGKSMFHGLSRFVPSIREQLEDWEEGLSENDADGSFLHENWNKDLRLFGEGEDGGRQLLQLFILRAEAELQAVAGHNLAQNLHCLDSLRSHGSTLLGGQTVKTPSPSSQRLQPEEDSRHDKFKPRKLSNHNWTDAKYRGDWMKRPISNNEIAWLAKLMVRLSIWLNRNFGLNPLDRREVGQMVPTCSYVEVPGNVVDVRGPAETTKAVCFAVGSWLLTVGLTLIEQMRRHGLRVNLRVLASKKIMLVIFMVLVFSSLKKAFRLVFNVEK